MSEREEIVSLKRQIGQLETKVQQLSGERVCLVADVKRLERKLKEAKPNV